MLEIHAACHIFLWYQKPSRQDSFPLYPFLEGIARAGLENKKIMKNFLYKVIDNKRKLEYTNLVMQEKTMIKKKEDDYDAVDYGEDRGS